MHKVTNNERAGEMLGVSGRFFGVVRREDDGRIVNQRFVSHRRSCGNLPGYSSGDVLNVSVRFDDECRNGHETFYITGDIRSATGREIAGGCLHAEISVVFPELAPLIQWHLCSTDGPMHYIANTIYLAGDADCNGRRKGEPSQWEYGLTFGGVPALHMVKPAFYKFLKEAHPRREELDVVALRYDEAETYKAKYSFTGFGAKWHEGPFDSEIEAVRFLEAFQSCVVTFDRIATAYSKGKDRELDAARRCAVWPDASDEELSAPRDALRAALEKRLPHLIQRFRGDMLGAGFIYPDEVLP